MRGLLPSLALVGSLLANAVHAQARESAQSVEGRARELFEAADRALDEGRFAEARDLLSESLGVYPVAATAYNLAVALRGTGEVVRAASVLSRLRSGEFGMLDELHLVEARDLEREIAAMQARLRITACGAPASELRIDGARIGDLTDCVSAEYATDPGPHRVLVLADGFQPEEREIVATRGGIVELAIELQAVPIARPVAAVPEPRRASRSFWQGPWPWVVAGALVAAGGVAAAIVVRPKSEPISDPIFGQIVTLDARPAD